MLNEDDRGRLGSRRRRTGRRGLRALIALAAGFTLAIGGVPAVVSAADATSTDIVVTKRVVAQPLGVDGSIGADDSLTAGSVYRLHEFTTVAAGPGAAIPDAWATCTITAGGSCLINVPQTQVGGVNNGRQFWVVEETSAPGTYSNPMLRLGNVSGPINDLYYPGFTVPMAPNTVQQLPRTTVTATNPPLGGSAASQLAITRSFGALAGSLDNPPIAPTCVGGLRIAIQMDLSASVNAQQREQFRQALVGPNGLFDALTGTGSSVAVFSFNDTSPAGGNTNQVVPLSVDTQRTELNNAVVVTSSGTSTNWDRALRIIAENQAQNYDALLFVTDGAPNNISAANGTSGVAVDAANVALRSLEAAIYSANAVKAQGVRMISVGVGAGILGATENLRAVSGPTGGLDYFQTADWSALTQQMSNLANALTCQVPVVARKWVVDEFGQNETLTDGWNITLGVSDISVGGVVINEPATQATGSPPNPTGEANWLARFDEPGATATITLSEELQEGYDLFQAVCVVSHFDQETQEYSPENISRHVYATTETVIQGILVTDRVACDYYNIPPVPEGQFQVVKVVDNPAGMPFEDSFSGTWECITPADRQFLGTWAATSTQPSAVFPNIPVGSLCTITENPPVNPPSGEWAPVVVDPDPLEITSETEIATVTATNTLTPLIGGFQVAKTVVNEGDLPFVDLFTGTWTCTTPWSTTLSGTWSATSAQPSDIIVEAPLGSTCEVAENGPATPPDGAWLTPTIDPAQFEITSVSETDMVTVTVTNTLVESAGAFTITKVVQNPDDLAYTDEFSGAYSCVLDGETVGGEWTLSAGQTTAELVVELGSVCTVTETKPTDPNGGAWQTPSISPATFTVESATTVVDVTVTNTLAKHLPPTGGAAPTLALTAGAALLMGGTAMYLFALARRRRHT